MYVPTYSKSRTQGGYLRSTWCRSFTAQLVRLTIECCLESAYLQPIALPKALLVEETDYCCVFSVSLSAAEPPYWPIFASSLGPCVYLHTGAQEIDAEALSIPHQLPRLKSRDFATTTGFTCSWVAAMADARLSSIVYRVSAS